MISGQYISFAMVLESEDMSQEVEMVSSPQIMMKRRKIGSEKTIHQDEDAGATGYERRGSIELSG